MLLIEDFEQYSLQKELIINPFLLQFPTFPTTTTLMNNFISIRSNLLF